MSSSDDAFEPPTPLSPPIVNVIPPRTPKRVLPKTFRVPRKSAKAEVKRQRHISSFYREAKDDLDSSSSNEDNEQWMGRFQPANISLPTNCVQYIINTVPISFPFQAYPSQLAIMSKMTRAMQFSQHALLESPTGTGKTMALLCASLAWLDKRRQETQQAKQTWLEQCIALEKKKSTEKQVTKRRSIVSVVLDEDGTCKEVDDEDVHAASLAFPPEPDMTVPKIYIGSRTHKQLSQVVKEMKRTIYRPRMTVLASRDHLCLHPDVSKQPNKSDLCTELIRKGSCSYYNNLPGFFQHFSKQTADLMDLEDMRQLGQKKRCCPFFMSRHFAQEAEVLLAPYQYILDPSIRDSMQMNVENSVIILDEAHNVEDVCRDAASLEVSVEALFEAIKHLKFVMLPVELPAYLVDSYRYLLLISEKMIEWMQSSQHTFPMQEVDKQMQVWQGPDIYLQLDQWHLSEDLIVTRFEPALSAAQKASDDFFTKQNGTSTISKLSTPLSAKEKEELLMPVLSNHILRTFQSFKRIFASLHSDNLKDYRMVLTKRVSHSSIHYLLSFWCLNPAVVFEPLSRATRCMILTSGTLSPMQSFSGELSTQFPQQLSAGHVIQPHQLHLSVLSYGESGTRLDGTFSSTETFAYQDTLGSVLLNVMSVSTGSAHGVIVFVPSYPFLEKCQARWKLTGLWPKMTQKCQLFVEPRQGQKEFDRVLKKFYSFVDGKSNEKGDSSLKSHKKGRNATLFAVYRGKVSEGIDFSNQRARVVCLVGIPFPNTRDCLVQMKRRYNDERRHNQDRCGQSIQGNVILSGNEWYEIQAFRAVNQAMGRCIRHANDWGAVLLLDSRYQERRTQRHFASWIQRFLSQGQEAYSDWFQQFQNFMKEWSGLNKENPIEIVSTNMHVNAVEQPVVEQVLSPTEILSEQSVIAPPEQQASNQTTPISPEIVQFNDQALHLSSEMDEMDDLPNEPILISTTLSCCHCGNALITIPPLASLEATQYISKFPRNAISDHLKLVHATNNEIFQKKLLDLSSNLKSVKYPYPSLNQDQFVQVQLTRETCLLTIPDLSKHGTESSFIPQMCMVCRSHVIAYWLPNLPLKKDWKTALAEDGEWWIWGGSCFAEYRKK